MFELIFYQKIEVLHSCALSKQRILNIRKNILLLLMKENKKIVKALNVKENIENSKCI